MASPPEGSNLVQCSFLTCVQTAAEYLPLHNHPACELVFPTVPAPGLTLTGQVCSWPPSGLYSTSTWPVPALVACRVCTPIIPQFGPALDLPTRTGLPRPSPRTSLAHPPPSLHCIVTELCTVSVNFFFSSVFNQLFLLVWDKMASHVQLITARMRSGPC